MRLRPHHVVLAVGFVAVMHAQQPLSLRDAIARALESHPLLAVSAARIAVSEGLRLQAGLRPNPRLILQGENLRPYGGEPFRPSREIDAFAYVTQTWQLGDKRQRRVEYASAGVRLAQLERELLAKQIAGRVGRSYWNAAGAQKIHALLLETIDNFQGVIQYHESRVREGAMAEADLLKVRIEGQRYVLAANSAALDAERARIQLLRDMGQTEFDAAVRLSDDLDATLPQPVTDVARALEQRTEVRIARQARDAAQAHVRLQQANGRSDLDFSLGYKRTSGFSSALAGVQVPLRFSDRNQGNIAVAEAEVGLAESDLAAVSAVVRAEVRAAEADVQARYRQLTGLLRGLVDQAAESSRIAQAAYREGGSGLLQLLDAERVLIDLRTLYYRTLAEYRQSVVGMDIAMGAQP